MIRTQASTARGCENPLGALHTCHEEKAGDVHAITGYVKGISHPTRGKHDPARPGKRFTCTSCHEPHSAFTKDLYQFEVKTRIELCAVCHRKK
jgi:predicted CXXCH cytochrome family protein